MVYIIGIGESTNWIFTMMPVLMFILSGYSIGSIMSKIRKTNSIISRDLIYGNIILNFLFITGFIFFGVLTNAAIQYFTVFTYLLMGLSILAVYLLLKKQIYPILHGVDLAYAKLNIKNINFLRSSIFGSHTNLFIPFGLALLVTLLGYQTIIIYYHPIYSEYDSIFRFLPISKSILLGNGLNHDFYLGSDLNMRFPPYNQALNAWLMQSFEYSSIRFFPIYYVSFTAILVYYITRNILSKKSSGEDASFFGLVSSCGFLITPAIIVTSSRFSLQQDIGFLFFLTASFYFFFEIARYDRPAKATLLMLSSSMALMVLTREIGLVITTAIFFLLPAIKYTETNLKLRFLFTVLSFFPLYILALKDLIEIGITYTTAFRFIILLVSNFAIFGIVSKLKNQNKVSILVRSRSNLTLAAPLLIPGIFILINLITLSGPFPNITFAGKLAQNLPIYNEISGVSSHLVLDLLPTLYKLPRIDILFVSLAVGSAFLFFKLAGLGKIIYGMKNNYQFSLLLILLIQLLVIWSFLLQSGFESSDIRHLAYFIPILSVILSIGMQWKNDSSSNKVFSYGLVVIVTIYYTLFNLYVWNYHQHFGGFWIEPNLSAFITFDDLRFAGMLMGILILVILGVGNVSKSKKYNTKLPIIGILFALLVLQIYVLTNSGIILAPLQKIDKVPPSKWETNLFEVIDYLNKASDGNVLSVRAPAIPFFTNRTNFDFFNPQAFSDSIASLLPIENSRTLKDKLSEMDIKYIVIPNERNSLYNIVKNLMNKSKLVQLINSDDDFDSINFDEFSLYRLDPNLKRINLLDTAYTWKSTKNLDISKNTDNLQMLLITNETQSKNNYAYLATQSNISQTPILLSMNYTSMSLLGTATFKIDIYDLDEQRTLYSTMLNNTSGRSIDQTFVLPDDIVLSRYLEFRLYISADGPGEHILNFKRITLA